MNRLTPEFEVDIRRAVNPLYVNQRGTESYERAALLGEIDRLRMRVSELERYLHICERIKNDGWIKYNDLITSEREGWRYADELEQELNRLHSSIKQTLDENGHLADDENCALIALKRALGIQQCKKCGADMQPGVAMGQTFTGSPDFIGSEVCTVSLGGPGKLIECSKCPECGWSVTA